MEEFPLNHPHFGPINHHCFVLITVNQQTYSNFLQLELERAPKING